MATVNVGIGLDWQLVIDDDTQPFFASSDSASELQFAVTDTFDAPIVKEGHTLRDRETLTRSVIGPGYVHFRSTGRPVILVVT